MPKLDAVFTGTGDLFTSMLLAWLFEYPKDLKVWIYTGLFTYGMLCAICHYLYNFKGYLPYKTILCHKAALDV